MGTSNYEIFDISSDDEEEEDCGQPGDWLKGLLDDEKEDSDEVEIVGEVEGTGISSVAKSNDEDDDDDECLILDGDPDKPAEVANDDTGNDEDELMVTGEKGQIACRDYPHPRHLCARYPFTTNPHEKYCDLCHCYVCDIKAPCIYWGTGVSSADHCHSSDKEEIWKLQRKWIKQGKPAPLVTAYHPPVGPPVHKHIRAPSLAQPMNNGSTQPYTLRPCSSQRNHHPPGVTAGRNSVAHPGVNTSTPLSSGSNIRSNIQRDRANVRFASPHANFKKVNRSGPGICNNNYAYTYAMAQSLNNNPKSVTYSGIQSTQFQDSFIDSQSHNILQTQSYIQPVPQPHAYSQPVPQPHAYGQPVPLPQAHGQSMPQPQAHHQPVPQPQAYYSQPVPQPQVYMQPVPQPQAYSQPMHQPSQNHINTYPLNQAPNMVNQSLPGVELHLLNNTVQNLAPSEYSHFSNVQPTSVPSPVTQLSSQQSEPLSSVTTQFSGVQLSSKPSPIMQPTSGLTIQLSSVKPSSEPSPVAESFPQSLATTNLGSDDFDLDSWFESLGQQPDLITGNGNLQSEPPGLIPSSMLMYDFENPSIV